MTLRCGRLDRHDPHEWRTPRTVDWPGGGPYHCTGHVITEGAWAAYAARADAEEAAQDRAARAGREAS